MSNWQIVEIKTDDRGLNFRSPARLLSALSAIVATFSTIVLIADMIYTKIRNPETIVMDSALVVAFAALSACLSLFSAKRYSSAAFELHYRSKIEPLDR